MDTVSNNEIVLLTLCEFAVLSVRFEWIAIFIILNEIFLFYEYFFNYIKHYRSKREQVEDWCKNNYFKDGIIMVLISSGPFLIEKSLTLFISVVKLYLFTIGKSLFFLVGIFVCYYLCRFIYRSLNQ